MGDGIFELYGFATEQELNSFKLLIGVSGVGPKAALAILSVGTPEHLTMAVITGDEKALTAAPGVGKKLAQRILLELKDKIAKETQEIGLPASASLRVRRARPSRPPPRSRCSATRSRTFPRRSRAWTWRLCRSRRSCARA